jgi:hypothetical protein
MRRTETSGLQEAMLAMWNGSPVIVTSRATLVRKLTVVK